MVFGKLVVVKKTGDLGEAFEIDADISCGRDKECDIRIKLPSVSRQHFKIRVDENGNCLLENISSTNPTLINNRESTRSLVTLQDGDEIKVADRKLIFSTVKRVVAKVLGATTSNGLPGFVPVLETIEEVNTSNLSSQHFIIKSIEQDSATLLAEKNHRASSGVVLPAESAVNIAEDSVADLHSLKASVDENVTNPSPASLKKHGPRKNTPRKSGLNELSSSHQAPAAESPLLVSEAGSQKKRKLATPQLIEIQSRRVDTPKSASATPVASTLREVSAVAVDGDLTTAPIPQTIAVIPTTKTKEVVDALAEHVVLLSEGDKASKKLGTPLLKSIQNRRVKTPVTAAVSMQPLDEVIPSVGAAADGSATSRQPVSLNEEETKEEVVEEDMPQKKKLGTPILKGILTRRVATPASGVAIALSSAPLSPQRSATSNIPVLSSAWESPWRLKDDTPIAKQEETQLTGPVPIVKVSIPADNPTASKLLISSSKAKLGSPLLESIQSRRVKTPSEAVEVIVEGEAVVKEAVTTTHDAVIYSESDASLDIQIGNDSAMSPDIAISKPECAATAIPAISLSPAPIQVLSADIALAVSARRKSVGIFKSPIKSTSKSPIESAGKYSFLNIQKSAPLESKMPVSADTAVSLSEPVLSSSAAEFAPTKEGEADMDDLNTEVADDKDYLATVAEKRRALPSLRLSFSSEVAAVLLQGVPLSDTSDAIASASTFIPLVKINQQANKAGAALKLAKRAEARLERIKRNFIAAIKSRRNQERAILSKAPIAFDIAANIPTDASTAMAEDDGEEEEEISQDETVTNLLQEPPTGIAEQHVDDKINRRAAASRWPRLDRLSGSTKSFFRSIRIAKRTCLLRRPATSTVTEDDVEASGVLTRAAFVATCAQISVDAFASELERKGVAEEKAYGEALGVFLSDPQAFMEDEEPECIVQSQSAPEPDGATDVIPVAFIASSPKKKNQRRRESLLMSLEKKNITTGRGSFLTNALKLGFGADNRSTLSHEAESLCCDLIASLSDEEMRLIDEYAEKLELTGLESAEAHAVAVDCYIRGIERCNDLLSTTAEATVSSELLASESASEFAAEEETAHSAISATAAVAAAPVASKATAELGFFGSSLGALFNDGESFFQDEQLVSFYADHMSETSGVDPSVAYGIALDSFLADTALFRSKVGRIYAAPNTPALVVNSSAEAKMEQQHEETEAQGTDDKPIDLVGDKPTITSPEWNQGQSVKMDVPAQTVREVVKSVVAPMSQEAAPVSEASNQNVEGSPATAIDEAVAAVPEFAMNAAPSGSASAVKSGKKKPATRGKAKAVVAAAISEEAVSSSVSMAPSCDEEAVSAATFSEPAAEAVILECPATAEDPQKAIVQRSASILKKRPAYATAVVGAKQPAGKRVRKVAAAESGNTTQLASVEGKAGASVPIKSPAASRKKAYPFPAVTDAAAAAVASKTKSAAKAPVVVSSHRKPAAKTDVSVHPENVVTPSFALFTSAPPAHVLEVDAMEMNPEPAAAGSRRTKRSASSTAAAPNKNLQKKRAQPALNREEEEEALAILCDGCDGEFVFEELGLAAVPEGDWFCKKCVKTKQGKAKCTPKAPIKALVILCDGCDGEFVFEELGLAAVPEGDWFCKKCVKTRQGKAKSTPKTSAPNQRKKQRALAKG